MGVIGGKRKLDWHGLRLSLHAVVCLDAGRIASVEEAAALGPDGLLRLPYMGVKGADEVWAAVCGRPGV